MEQKRKLFIDYDQTICESIVAITSMYNIDYCDKVGFTMANPYLVNDWNFKDQCTLSNKKKIDSYFNSKRFFNSVNFIENAKEIIDKLSETFDIYIVSMGGFRNLHLKKRWCKENLPYAKFIGCNFMFHKDKRDVPMGINDIFIDDCFKNLINSSCGNRLLYGDIYSWNQDNEKYGYGVFKRLWNWTEVYDYLMN